MKTGGLILFSTLILSGCASLDIAATTPYQPETALSLRGGYSEKKTSDSTYQVKFQGNGFVSETMAGDLALMRGAELCQMAGYPYFRFVSGSIKVTRVISQGVPSHHPGAEAVIECLHEPAKGAGPVDVTLSEMRTKYSQFMPKPKKHAAGE